MPELVFQSLITCGYVFTAELVANSAAPCLDHAATNSAANILKLLGMYYLYGLASFRDAGKPTSLSRQLIVQSNERITRC